jgi:diaminohydroxyphosphoribosylaminopyrimidine deaminase/5-amino-6-(5-phosphoribosylamino)uracil reductase
MPLQSKMQGLLGENWILTCSEDQQKKIALEAKGFKVFQLESNAGRLSLSAVMVFLGQKHLNNILVEAGAVLNGALLEADVVDEWVVYMAPCVLGDQGRGLFNLPALHNMADKKQLKMQAVRQVGPDLKLTFRINK